MTDFNDRIERLAELEGKATPGEWVSGTPNSLAIDLKGKRAFLWVITNQQALIPIQEGDKASFDCELAAALRNQAVPLLREMAQALSEARAENERLREGIGRAVDCLRRDCESFGELSSAVCDAQEQLEALHDA